MTNDAFYNYCLMQRLREQQSIDGLTRYVILGNPIPLARPRLSRTRVYDPQVDLKRSVATILKSQHGSKPLYEEPMHLQITFFMPVPKARKSQDGWHSKRPDLSNMIKFYEDVAQDILFEDDSKIAKITATKVYDCLPRVELILTTLT